MGLFNLMARFWPGIVVAPLLIILLGACSSAPVAQGDQDSMDAARERADEAKVMAESLNAQKLFPSRFEMGEDNYAAGVAMGNDGDFAGGIDSFSSAEQFYTESYEMAVKAREEAEQAIGILNDSIKETEAAAAELAREAGA